MLQVYYSVLDSDQSSGAHSSASSGHESDQTDGESSQLNLYLMFFSCYRGIALNMASILQYGFSKL